jgi:hypothetical protein
MIRWLKHVVLILMLPLLICASPHQSGGGGGGEVPFPWGTEAPFPWATIEGIWQANLNGVANYFSFRVIGQPTANRATLEILVVNPRGHEVYGSGTGIATLNNRIIEGRILRGTVEHQVLIRAYESEANGRTVLSTVITVRRLAPGSKERHAIMIKVSPVPVMLIAP